MENIENFNGGLLARYLSNDVSPQEKLEVEMWLSQTDENRNELKEIQKLLENTDAYYKAKSFNTGNAWKKVYSEIHPAQSTVVQHKKVRKETIALFYKYAAIIVIAILLGSVGYYIGFRNQSHAVYSEFISGENTVNEFVLPDGSEVTLNSNSKLHFPKHFDGNVREVTVTGEAFFDVKPNPEKPFVINAGNAQVKVLGTSFNVCAYPENETVEVVVKTGKVEVIRKITETQSGNSRVFLTPGEKGTFFIKNNVLEKSLNHDLNFMSWKTHDLVFNEIPLSEVIRCLEKVYRIDIHVTEPELNDLLLTAHFDKKPVDFVLNVVRLTFNLELTGESKQFTLSGRNNKK